MRKVPVCAARTIAGVVVLVGLASACGEPERRPAVDPSHVVTDMRLSAGAGVQDCGEAAESKTDTACRVHSVGECLARALADCRPAYGMRSYFGSEGDAVRVDWLVLKDGHGGCKLMNVLDKTADPLAKERGPVVTACAGILWKPHETIGNCEAPVADRCEAKAPAASAAGDAQTGAK